MLGSAMHPVVALVRSAESFRARAAMGDVSGAGEIAGALGASPAPLARAWQCAVRAQAALLVPGTLAAPTEADLEPFVAAEPDARRAAAHAARDLARAAFLQLEPRALERRTALLARLAAGATCGSDDLAVDVDLARAASALLHGASAPVDLDALAGRAAAARLAGSLVEAHATRALHALESGDHVTGLALARRASLMARTEGILEPELFANLVLVRARRYNRQAHLALRIAEALEKIAPPAWRAWLAWERMFAGGAPDAADVAGGPARDVAELLAAARAGDRPRFDGAADALARAVAAAPLRRDTADLVAALVPDEPPTSDELASWRDGTTALPPRPLHGVAVPLLGEVGPDGGADAEPEPEPAAAYVLLRPGAPGARFLRAGLGLATAADVARVRQSRRPHGRVESLLAILALAGPGGIEEPVCFSRAYGFTYTAALHRGVFDVLIYRARAAVEGVATLARGNGRLALATEQPLLIPDPSTSRSTTDRVLRLLAEHGRASAKEAAARLGISLRAVQGALNELAGSEACVVERDGRHVTYVVEDSVFSEPTRRFGPPSPGGGATGVAGALAASERRTGRPESARA
jgi:hypothetical protein